jgi:hypothetical protein
VGDIMKTAHALWFIERSLLDFSASGYRLSVLLKNLRDKSVFEKATQELEFIKSNEINAVYFQDEDYRNG